MLKKYLDLNLLSRIESANIESIKILVVMIRSLKQKRVKEGETGYMVYESAEKYG